MLPNEPLTRLLGAAAILFLATGCSDDDETTAPVDRTGSVCIQLRHVVGDQDLVLHSIQYENAAGNEYGVESLHYYLSDFALTAAGNRLALDDLSFDLVHYVDAESTSTLEFHLDGVPEGRYDDVVFTFGLDDEKNVAGALSETEVNRNMSWPEILGDGYHYMKLQGWYLVQGSDPVGFKTHTGRLHQDPDPPHPHFFSVTLTPEVDVVRGEVTEVEILADVNEWYTGPNDIDLETHSTAIMANTEAQDLVQQNGASVFRLANGAGGRPRHD